VHAFAVSASEPFPVDVAVGTIANEAIAQEAQFFSDAEVVHWVLGDESTADHTLTSTEQGFVKQYLEGGGTLFISGSELGWDLGRTHAASEPGDLSFYNSYLKSTYVFDGNSGMTQASGVAGTPLQGYTWTFGQTFPEDYPDDIEPVGGASALLTYNATRDGTNPRKAAVAYSGPFGGSAHTGRLVYLAFPFESLLSKLTRSVLFDRSLQFVGVVTSAGPSEEVLHPHRPTLQRNYPNPFNPTTHIVFSLPERMAVNVHIYDLLGRRIAVVADGTWGAGTHVVPWNASGHASGPYVVRLQAGGISSSHMILLSK
jgi:hypothetical protein